MKSMKHIRMVLVLVTALNLVMVLPDAFSEMPGEFRQEHGLHPYEPPGWFLRGYFVAREKDPGCLFGPVRDFAETLGERTTWLIEDTELERVKEAAREGKTIEYSVFLEVASPDQTVYWVFVVLPYETADAWYQERRAYHGRGKARAYYGKTRDELNNALAQGFRTTAELRFLIEKEELSSQIPEEAILKETKCRPVLDLHTGLQPEQPISK